jgi:Flp pilus assembly protein TadB
MTTDDPFERAVAREEDLRVLDESDDELVQQSARSSLHMAVFLAATLPVHLWLTEWSWSGWLTAHVVVLLLCASHAFNAANDRRRMRRAPVIRRRFAGANWNFIVYGRKKKERW